MRRQQLAVQLWWRALATTLRLQRLGAHKAALPWPLGATKRVFEQFFFAAISIVKVAAMPLILLSDAELLRRAQGLSLQRRQESWLTSNQKSVVATAIKAIEAAMLKVPKKKRRTVWYHWWRTYVDRKQKTGVPAPSRDNRAARPPRIHDDPRSSAPVGTRARRRAPRRFDRCRAADARVVLNGYAACCTQVGLLPRRRLQ